MAAPPLRWYFDFISPFSYLQWQKLKPLLRERETRHAGEAGADRVRRGARRLRAEGPGRNPGQARVHLSPRAVAGAAAGRAAALPADASVQPAGRAAPVHRRGRHARGGRYDLRLDLARRPRGRQRRGAGAAAGRAGHRRPKRSPPHATKAALRANTEAAIAAGVYGVPTLSIGGELFWGNDAYDFALAALHDPTLLQDDEMVSVTRAPGGRCTRRRLTPASGTSRQQPDAVCWPSHFERPALPREGQHMRIGLVVDSACDLP